ncbi:MAG: thioredoxin family protein [Desulfosudis oleivorans]|nr:thioredoxin family protein [Desulfosudis oleivorans]
MDIKVLGTGCANCRTTLALIEQVAQARGVPVTLGKVEDLREIMGYGVMSHARRGDRRQGRARRRRAEPREDREVARRSLTLTA